VTAPDTPYPLSGIEDEYVPDLNRIADAVRELMEMVP
jgi:pyruvate/2-oxoglutarate/acetoin dehydrogenase E1 component